MPERIGLAIFRDLIAFPFGAFGKQNERVAAGVFLLVLEYQAQQFVRLTLYSGMQHRMEQAYAV